MEAYVVIGIIVAIVVVKFVLDGNKKSTVKSKPVPSKPVQKKPSEPFKFPEFKIDPVLPLSFFKKTAPDPELVRLEQKYNQMVSESNQPKGLPGILGIKKYD